MDDASKSAAAARKFRQKSENISEKSGDAAIAYTDDSTQGQESEGAQQQEKLTTSARAHQWFRKRLKNRGTPRLLDIPNEMLISNGGPLQISGNTTLVHEDGEVEYANHLNLCRCGHSRSKPMCDDQHLEIEFFNLGKIFDVSEVAASSRPNRITITCIEDGPITFRGRLRLHNQFGQECIKMSGSLCRCGHSARKPFCDGSHSRVGFKTG